MVGRLRSRVPGARVSFSLFFILLSLCAPRIVSANRQDEAYGLIQRADEAVSSAFEAVLEAEGAGANVSALIVRLNEAAGFLAEATILLENGGFDGAFEVADRSVEVADGVGDEAMGLWASALAHRDFVFKVSLIGSVVGVSVFLFFMLLLWHRFKGFYFRRLLSMRPEVASDVEPSGF